MAIVPPTLGPAYVDDRGNAGEPVALLRPSPFTGHRMWFTRLPRREEPALIVSRARDEPRVAERLPNGRHVDVARGAHLTPPEMPQAANGPELDFVRQLPRAS